jgi:hypothetical protein
MFRVLHLTAIAMLGLGTATALAQTPQAAGETQIPGIRPGHEPGIGQSFPLSDKASNITAADSKEPYAPTLPDTGLGENASPEAYLNVARDALEFGRTGQAQQALEMAETRLLAGDVLATQISNPSHSPRVSDIAAAREALGRGDTAAAINRIDEALHH